jgi:2-phosphosulfolactate phosphatase
MARITNPRQRHSLTMQKLETCFSPSLFESESHLDSIVVIIDVLRASSAICTAFANGVASIIPVTGVEEAKDYKSKGYLVAAERDGFVLDFADFGNSPFNFTKEKVEGKTIVYSTTNGTGLINLTLSSYKTVIGSFLNIDALATWLIKQQRDVLLLCAGWKNRFNIEDSVCAGAISDKLMMSSRFTTVCDSTYAAMDLWSMARKDLPGYMEKAAQRTRLRDKKLDDCIEFCLTPDFTDKIPVMKNGVLINTDH